MERQDWVRVHLVRIEGGNTDTGWTCAWCREPFGDPLAPGTVIAHFGPTGCRKRSVSRTWEWLARVFDRLDRWMGLP